MIFFFLLLVLIEEDIISFYSKQHTINHDKTHEEKPLKSRLRQNRRVKYNYDDDSTDSNQNYDTDEYNNESESDGMVESTNNKNNESFVSEYSNYTPRGICKDKSKSKGSERKQNKSRLNNDNIDIDIDMYNNNNSNKSKDKNKSKKNERNAPSMRDIAKQTGLRSRKKDNDKNEAKIPRNCDMNALSPEVLKDMNNLSREEFFKKRGFSYSKRILQQMDKIERIKKKSESADQEPMPVSQEQVAKVMNQVVERAKSGGDGGCNIQVSKEKSSDSENEYLMHHCNENNNNNNSNNISMNVDEEQKKEKKENDMDDIGMNLGNNTNDNVEKKNVDDIMNDNNGSNDHDSDSMDKYLSELVEKYQKCLESSSSNDILSVIDETDTFIQESSHNDSDSGIFDIFASITPLLRAVKRLIKKSKQESENNNNDKSDKSINIQTSMIKNQLKFLQSTYETDLKSMKMQKKNDKKDDVFQPGAMNDFGSDGINGIYGMSLYDDSSWSISNANENYNQEKFGPSRGISYNSIEKRLEAEPYRIHSSSNNKKKVKKKQS